MEFQISVKELVAIYDAGRTRGNDEATAYDWGTSPTGNKFDELENVLVWNDETSLVADMDYDDKIKWWKLVQNAIKEI